MLKQHTLHYKGEVWHCVKITHAKRYYRNSNDSLLLCVNFITGHWSIKRLLPEKIIYGNNPDAWDKHLPSEV